MEANTDIKKIDNKVVMYCHKGEIMFEKIKKIFAEKDEKKKTENLVAFLIILVVTLIFMNKILKNDSKNKEETFEKKAGVELVNEQEENVVLVENKENDLEKELEEILSKIKGVRKS